MRKITSRKFGAAAVSGIAVAALLLTGCVQSDRDTNNNGGSSDNGSNNGGSSEVDGTFIFAASNDPRSLDPAFANDGESFRVSRNIFEGLIGVQAGTADPAPLLAETWESAPDGMSHTFQLKEGVKFHDDTDFNSDAVCFNFERWYNWEGLATAESVSYYYSKLFQGFASNPENAVYDSCVTNGDYEVTINLNKPFAGFIAALSLPAFAMQSPTALEEYDADNIGGDAESPSLSTYAMGHPTGTGPFSFVEWSVGEQVELTAFDGYWGEQGDVTDIIFRIITEPNARRQALEAGSIDGYDLVGPADTQALEEAGYFMQSRPPFTVLYLAMNQAIPELQDERVRQAISHAIDKDALINQVLPEGTQKATQFMPPVVNGYNEDVTVFEYDVDKAKALLAEAGYDENNPLTIDFNYPVNVSRPYMPTPEQIFTVLASQLGEAGIEINAITNEWGDYINRMTGSTDHGIHLLGWTGDYNDSDNFVGVFFGQESLEWGFTNESIFSKLVHARGVSSIDEQTALYEEINAEVADFIPGVPLAHPAPTLAFSDRVTSYPASPVNDEVYNEITLSR